MIQFAEAFPDEKIVAAGFNVHYLTPEIMGA